MKVSTTGKVGTCGTGISGKVGTCGTGTFYPTSVTSYNQLANKPTINGETIQGDKQDKDYQLYGVNNPEIFIYNQTTPSDRWEIKHNLNKFPSITVVDSAGSVVIGEYEFVDSSTVICSFSGAFSGICYLN